MVKARTFRQAGQAIDKTNIIDIITSERRTARETILCGRREDDSSRVVQSTDQIVTFHYSGKYTHIVTRTSVQLEQQSNSTRSNGPIL